MSVPGGGTTTPGDATPPARDEEEANALAQNGSVTPAAPAARVLIVDDNKIYRDAFRRNLMLQKFEVAEAEDAESALASIREAMPDVVITDLQMRTETEGLDLIRQVKSTWPLLPIIMISAVGTFEDRKSVV